MNNGAKSPERSFGRELNVWMQTIAIIVAASWGIYTFVYKEIILPKSTPVNVTMDLQLKKIGTSIDKGDQESPLVAVEMKVRATNPSSRSIYLLPSTWKALGSKVTYESYNDNRSFYKASVEALKRSSDTSWCEHVERHCKVGSSSLISVGSLFIDDGIKPGESIQRTVILHVPPHKYDLLEVHAIIPTVTQRNEIDLEWQLDEEKDLGIRPVVYRLNGAKQRDKKIEPDEYGKDAKIIRLYELQLSRCGSQISLWR